MVDISSKIVTPFSYYHYGVLSVLATVFLTADCLIRNVVILYIVSLCYLCISMRSDFTVFFLFV